MVYLSLVYSRLNYGILNWAKADWSSIADLVKLNNRGYSKLIAESVFHSEIYFIQHGYCRSRVSTIMN